MPVASRKIRSLIAIVIWFAITGSTVVHCSSGSGDSLLLPGNPNRAPIAEDSSIVAVVDELTSGFMQARDDDGDELTYSIVAGPRLGSVTHNGSTGAFLYIGNSPGNDSYSFRANDGKADSNTATVSITIVAAAQKQQTPPNCTTVVIACSTGGK